MYALPTISQNVTRGKVFSGGGLGGYLFGFNGKEKNDDWNGDGAMYDYGFRIYDPRIARFFSIDPFIRRFSFYSSYQYAGNTPIQAIDLDGLQIVNGAYNYAHDGTRLALKKGYSQEMADMMDRTVEAVHNDDAALFNFINKYDVVIQNGHLENQDNYHYGSTHVNKQTSTTTTFPNEAARLMSIYGDDYWNKEREKAYAEDDKNGNTEAFDAFIKRSEDAYNSGPIQGQTVTKVSAVITIDFVKIAEKYRELAGDIKTSGSTSTPERSVKHEFGHFFVAVKFFLHLYGEKLNATKDIDETNSTKIGNSYDGKPETQTDTEGFQLSPK